MFAVMAGLLALGINTGFLAISYSWMIPLLALECVFDAALYALWKAGKSQSKSDKSKVDKQDRVP